MPHVLNEPGKKPKRSGWNDAAWCCGSVPVIGWRWVVSVSLQLAINTRLFKTAFYEQEYAVDNLASALTMAAVSTFFNFLVIFYHMTQPAHPKFMLIKSRRTCLHIHMACGIMEICCACTVMLNAYYWGSHRTIYAQVVGVAGLIHAATAVVQTGIVFGARIIMRPSYYWVALMHFVAATATLSAPERPQRVIAQYIVLCIFTWCRVYIAVIGLLNYGTACVYTLSISLAGLTMFPHVLGPNAPIIFISYLSFTAVLWAWTAGVSFDSMEWGELTSEGVRLELFDYEAMARWRNLSANATPEESAAAARALFDRLDKDGSGSLDMSETEMLLKSLSIHPTVRNSLKSTLNRRGGQLDFDTFHRSVWNLASRSAIDWSEPSLRYADLAKITDPRRQARLVFDCIDLDKSGVLESFELSELLVKWGCPHAEVATYISNFDQDGDGHISFEDEFYPLMKPIWSFGFEYIILPQAKARENCFHHDMPTASPATPSDDRKHK